MDLLDTKSVYAMIMEALAERRRFTASSEGAIKQYVGKSYRVGFGADNFENFPYQYVTTVAPWLAMYAPTCGVTEGGVITEDTDTLEDGLKSWLRMSKMARTLIALAHDVQFDFGCSMTTLEPTPGWKGRPGPDVAVPMWPRTQRVSPRAVFRDPRAVEFGRSRFDGHMAIVDKGSLRTTVDAYGQPLYDPEAIEGLVGGAGLDELRKDLMTDGVSSFDTEKSVLLYCVVDNETGKVATYAAGGREGLVLIRQPVRADRHYTFFGIGIVPDQLYPLSPLAVTAQQVEEINQQRRFLSNSAGTAKTLTIINGTDAGLVENVTNAPHGGILCVPGFNGMMQKMDLGGPLQATYDYLAFAKGKLEELAGLNNNAGGGYTEGGVPTAAEVDEVAAGADSRRTFMRELFKEGVTDCLTGVVRLMDENASVRFPVTRMNTAGQIVKGTFYGGRDLEDDGSEFERCLTIEIEPNSMEHVNRLAQQAAMQAGQQGVLEILAAYAQNPAIKAQAMIDDRLQSLNIPHGAERYVDLEYMQQVIAAQQQAMAAAAANKAAGNGAARG